jgi:omega-6 fatty acid desaturase (delta-12 desaturase)
MAVTAITKPRGVLREPRVQNPWHETLAPYARPRLGRSILDLTTSVVPYLVLQGAMVALMPVAPWLSLLLGIPAAGFALRTFIVFHDCAHGSFLPSKHGNIWLGRVLGVLVYTPFGAWKHAHAMHHASAGDLDRRGDGDLPTMTVAEYRAASRGVRIGYRLLRHPAVMFTIGPLVSMVLQPRFTNKKMRPRIRNSVRLTNLALAVLTAALCWLVGWQTILLIQAPIVVVAGGVGVFLFFVQHQFDGTYWESAESWTYVDAALRGSSYLKLPKVLQFFTGNIGFHHVHHLSARIPNYNLQAAHERSRLFDNVPVLTLRDGLRATRLKLWDEDRRQLVTFAHAA